MNLRAQLIDFEGWRRKAYPDPLTHGAPWTIGVGHTGSEVHEGLVWDDDKINAALDADIHTAVAGVFAALPWAHTLDSPRQAVIIGMAFQMGLPRLLGFRRTLDDVMHGHYAIAAIEMLDSTWAHQTPRRAKRLSEQMRTGEWQ